MGLKHPKIRMLRLPDYRKVQLENRSSRQAQPSVATFFVQALLANTLMTSLQKAFLTAEHRKERGVRREFKGKNSARSAISAVESTFFSRLTDE